MFFISLEFFLNIDIYGFVLLIWSCDLKITTKKIIENLKNN